MSAVVATIDAAGSSESRTVRRSRIGLVAVLVGAGILHFVIPDAYARIVPRWFTRPRRVVYVSGVAEIITGVLVAL